MEQTPPADNISTLFLRRHYIHIPYSFEKTIIELYWSLYGTMNYNAYSLAGFGVAGGSSILSLTGR